MVYTARRVVTRVVVYLVVLNNDGRPGGILWGCGTHEGVVLYTCEPTGAIRHAWASVGRVHSLCCACSERWTLVA